MPAGKMSVMRLEADLPAFAAALDKSLEEMAKAIVFELLKRIVERTPVDTGRACGSWAVSQYTAGDWPGLPKDTSGGAAEREISLGTIGSVSFHPPVGIYWIFNNLPYIQVLEFGLYPGDGPKTRAGFSIQAPAGMVRVALAEIESEIYDIIRRAVK